MATGDKFYIADKETLDSVAQLAQKIHDDLGAMKVGNEEMQNQIADSGDYVTVDDIKKLRYGQKILPASSATTWSNHINIQGSGEIYGILYDNASFTQLSGMNYFRITVDDVVIYSSSSGVAGPHCYGLLTPGALVYGTDPRVYVPNGTGNDPVPLRSRSLITKENDNIDQTTNSLLYLPKPLKFNKSLVVSAYMNFNISQGAVLAIPGKIYYMYKLD